MPLARSLPTGAFLYVHDNFELMPPAFLRTGAIAYLTPTGHEPRRPESDAPREFLQSHAPGLSDPWSQCHSLMISM